MSDSRVGGYPMGVTDAAIERHFGGACGPRMCGNCRHFCGSDIHVDYGYCHIWEHIGFGDMLAYEAVHCPKCGAIIKRRA